MRVVHEADGKPRTLATEVEVAEGWLRQGVGLMFRRSIPDDYALAFPFDGQKRRGLHMLFVPFAIDAVWAADGVVQGVERLSAWTGRGGHVADLVVELPAGGADEVRPGDRLVVEGLD